MARTSSRLALPPGRRARRLLPWLRPLLASLRGARSTRLCSDSPGEEASLAVEATMQTLPEQVCHAQTPELVLTFWRLHQIKHHEGSDSLQR